MQPEFSPTPRTPEQGGVSPGHTYEVPPNYASAERGLHGSPEQYPLRNPERAFERSPIELAPPPPAGVPAAPPVQALPSVQPLATQPEVQNPVSASDDDTIEKEWVDRVKQVIVETRNDPRAREKAVGALQRDYLMKRYGKQLGATAD